MKVSAELLQIIPKEVQANAYCYYHSKQQTWYVYRKDGLAYDEAKGRSVERRTPLGQIKNGKWSYSPTWLRIVEAEQKSAQLAAGAHNPAVADAASANQPTNLPPSPAERIATPTSTKTIEALQSHAAAVPDRRMGAKTAFRLDHTLFIMLLASLGGFDAAYSIASYWKRNLYELKLMLPDLPDDLIAHDTINRLMRIINPEDLFAMMRAFTVDLIADTSNRIFHADGKAIRASKTDKCKGGRYILNIYESTHSLLVAQVVVGEKENEIVALKPVLGELNLKPGDIFTADALHTQKPLVAFLNERKVDWCLPVKDNHRKLANELRCLFSSPELADRKQTYSPQSPEGTEHGRIEIRCAEVLPGSLVSACFKADWPGLASGTIIRATTSRESISADSPPTCEERYFICSLPYGSDDSARIKSGIIRAHWSIENSLHWVLDVVFDEDRVHASDESYLYFRSMLKKVALNVLRNVQKKQQQRFGHKTSIKQLKELCTDPVGALEVLSMFFGHDQIDLDVKL